jgi:hypothetical protein
LDFSLTLSCRIPFVRANVLVSRAAKKGPEVKKAGGGGESSSKKRKDSGDPQ